MSVRQFNIKDSIVSSLVDLSQSSKGVTILKSDARIYISYKMLWNRALLTGKQLLARGARRGSEVLLCCSDTERYMYGFWACAIHGFIAIPVSAENNEYRNKMVEQILEKLDHPYLLYGASIENFFSIEENDRGVNLSQIDYVNAPDFSITDVVIPKGDDLVYVQFSSGSTGIPRGAAITNSNLMANIHAMVKHYELDQRDTILSWQPLTHCYGLVVYHLMSIVVGIDQYLIPTSAYMQNPLLWMNMVQEYRITRIGTIPFALKHFINFYLKANVPIQWDLSCVKSMLLGGEQVGSDLVEQFLELLQKQHLSKSAFLPAYGLAEATVMVASGEYQSSVYCYRISNSEIEIGAVVDCEVSKLSNEVTFLEMGTPICSVEIVILDDEGNLLPEKTFGYIALQGPSVAREYYKDSKETRNVLIKDRWWFTGDIGFMIHGKLVVVGREKELVISNGKKYSCIQVENILRQAMDTDLWKQVVVTNGFQIGKKAEGIIAFVATDLDMHKAVNVEAFITLIQKAKQLAFERVGVILDDVIPILELPKTGSGKIRRIELTYLYNKGEYTIMANQIASYLMQKQQKSEMWKKDRILDTIVETLYNLFGIQVSDFNLTFQEYGIISVNIPLLLRSLSEVFSVDIQVSDIFNHPTPDQLASLIASSLSTKMPEQREKQKENSENSKAQGDNKIAIIGMSCRFPGGANDIDQFWEMLVNGVDGVIEIPETRWDVDRYYAGDETVPGKMYCRKSGFLKLPIDEFDAKFFNISPREAAATDPQQRLLLELTWEAFENACLDITKFNGSDTGVYLGISSNEYTQAHLSSGDLTQIDAYSLTGTSFSVACGRLSYTFGFEGPSFAVDTACSSALTALHLACNAIQMDETELAVVAGVNLLLSPANSIGFTKLRATSPDGHSKAFDASANGYGRGEGGGVVLLKKLSKAIMDKDVIYGVICGTGINQDGHSNGLTAPNGNSQANLIRRTLKRAHLQPSDVDYMEMHGTGTKLGDPIEVSAVAETYGKGRTMDNPLRIGSVKSNIGHLEPASGIASLIKVLLSMKYALVPANLYFQTPNPLIDWDHIPLRVVDKHIEWKKEDGVRRAAISGFGFGGSNAHIIVEEYKEQRMQETSRLGKREGFPYILKISAKSEKALRNYVLKFIQCIDAHEEDDLADILYSANRGRTDFNYRLVAIGESKEELLYRLKSFFAGTESEGIECNAGRKTFLQKSKKLVFMFTGQGSQYVNMGKTLFATNEVFRESMYLCDKLWRPYILKSIIDLLYRENANSDMVEKTMYAQPLIFAIEYALCKMWESLGVVPDIVMGHSIGEYPAAVIAGIMSLEEAVKLVSIRGRLMDEAPGMGAMGTVFTDEVT
ncbi:MAG: AMP-binding protein, partial [Oscillospiraceae bacterium]|nr:AMP-binding protein [Oscillospiraceae bacterium]